MEVSHNSPPLLPTLHPPSSQDTESAAQYIFTILKSTLDTAVYKLFRQHIELFQQALSRLISSSRNNADNLPSAIVLDPEWLASTTYTLTKELFFKWTSNLIQSLALDVANLQPPSKKRRVETSNNFQPIEKHIFNNPLLAPKNLVEAQEKFNINFNDIVKIIELYYSPTSIQNWLDQLTPDLLNNIFPIAAACGRLDIINMLLQKNSTDPFITFSAQNKALSRAHNQDMPYPQIIHAIITKLSNSKANLNSKDPDINITHMLALIEHNDIHLQLLTEITKTIAPGGFQSFDLDLLKQTVTAAINGSNVEVLTELKKNELFTKIYLQNKKEVDKLLSTPIQPKNPDHVDSDKPTSDIPHNKSDNQLYSDTEKLRKILTTLRSTSDIAIYNSFCRNITSLQDDLLQNISPLGNHPNSITSNLQFDPKWLASTQYAFLKLLFFKWTCYFVRSLASTAPLPPPPSEKGDTSNNFQPIEKHIFNNPIFAPKNLVEGQEGVNAKFEEIQKIIEIYYSPTSIQNWLDQLTPDLLNNIFPVAAAYGRLDIINMLLQKNNIHPFLSPCARHLALSYAHNQDTPYPQIIHAIIIKLPNSIQANPHTNVNNNINITCMLALIERSDIHFQLLTEISKIITPGGFKFFDTDLLMKTFTAAINGKRIDVIAKITKNKFFNILPLKEMIRAFNLALDIFLEQKNFHSADVAKTIFCISDNIKFLEHAFITVIEKNINFFESINNKLLSSEVFR